MIKFTEPTAGKLLPFIHLGIGQGELELTQCRWQIFFASLPTKDISIRRMSLSQIGGKPNTSRNLAEKHYTKVSAENFDIIQDGMQRVVEAGTARIARFDTITICGKTGTAQNPHGKDHSLFVAFAPRENPRLLLQ
jgi:penicillin-binding protein 2